MGDRWRQRLVQGSLDLMVLSALADAAKYGYLIQQELNAASSGQLKLTAGTLYPLLHRLEAARLIRARWDHSTGRGRKWYELTAAGQRRLAQQMTMWTEYSQCVDQLVAKARRALPNLATGTT